MFTSNQKFSIKLDKLNNNTFFRVNVFGDTEILVEDVKMIAETCKVLGEGKILPVLILTDKFTLPSAEARKFIAQADSNPYAKAEAYVISDLPQKIVGNFFLKFDKPARPTKIFTKEEEAVEWLKQFF
ncbi:MAG: hypothetical protein ACK4ON_01785 [Bacteroidia bacterium]